MKNGSVVISGSSSLKQSMKKWFDFWQSRGFKVLDWPKPISAEEFGVQFPIIHKEFYKSLRDTDIHFVANEEKNGIEGYVGAGVFAEIAFRVGLNLIDNKDIPIILLNHPSKNVVFYDDLNLWLSLGWIRIFDKNIFSGSGSA